MNALLRTFCKARSRAAKDQIVLLTPLRMMTAVLVYEHPDASSIVGALEPDNTPEIKMEARRNTVEITVTTKQLRTLLATCDDLLSNLQIAQEMLSNVRA
jgi:hypothetical protein